MTTKERILELFESHRGDYFSGEDIARELALSRAAVWKAVKALQSDGYAIDAVPNKGYCLSDRNDILSVQGIRKYLQPQWRELDISVLSAVSSTNGVVREKAAAGAKEGWLVVPNEQTQGRGRMGRRFFSPPGTGIYMSLLLRPQDWSAEQAVRITTMAAVAMCDAIDALDILAEKKAQIKWVNDIFLDGRKVCGILTEGSFNLENGMLDYAVLGVGLNLYPPENGFPEELKSIAGSVFQEQKSDAKNRAAAGFLNRFLGYYSGTSAADHVEAYRQKCFVIGRPVTILAGRESRNAVVTGIDDQCRLLVRYENGEEGICSSGEISLRVDLKGSGQK